MNIVDSNNISYEVLEKLGEGSQGITYLLEDRKHIAKLFNQSIDNNSTKSKINFLINLGLDRRVFAIPLKQVTQPKNGYVAEFASGMIPMSLLKFGAEKTNLNEWYLSTGGLLKRYNVLIKLSSALRNLHSKGLTYCDLSPNNVFISENANSSNIFLIDLDNLRYKSSIINNIYTPFYGAPEVISSKAPNTTMSDCFSFAIIAYELLTLNHPLIGDYVTNGEPELEEQALAGEIPWVDHSIDFINERSTGVPSEIVMPDILLNLFRKNFELGLNNPFERPSMSEWFDALNRAFNELLKCGNNKCGLLYPYNNFKECCFCSHKPQKVTRIQMRRWEEVESYDRENNQIISEFRLEPTVYDEILIDENTPKEVAAFNFLLGEIDPLTAVIRIEYINDEVESRILLTPLNGIKFNISPRIGLIFPEKSITLQTPKKIRVVDSTKQDKLKYMLHLKDLTIPQRVLTID